MGDFSINWKLCLVLFYGFCFYYFYVSSCTLLIFLNPYAPYPRKSCFCRRWSPTYGSSMWCSLRHRIDALQSFQAPVKSSSSTGPKTGSRLPSSETCHLYSPSLSSPGPKSSLDTAAKRSQESGWVTGAQTVGPTQELSNKEIVYFFFFTMSWILIKAGFKRDELIHLVEEMIRQSSIQAVVRLMLPALTQVYSEEAKTEEMQTKQ